MEEDLRPSKEKCENLDKICSDFDAISNGHLEEIVAKKEKIKYQVLHSSDDDNEEIVELSESVTESESEPEEVETPRKKIKVKLPTRKKQKQV